MLKLPKKVNLGLKWNADVQKAVKKVWAWIRRNLPRRKRV